MQELEQLIEKLRKLEALHEGAASGGERAAAASAIDRVRQRLQDAEQANPSLEFSFSLGNPWSRNLFCALLRRYGLQPYRYRRQRQTTVMVRAPESIIQDHLWPEFCDLDRVLSRFLSDVTNRIIRDHVFGDTTDVEVRTGEPPPLITTTDAP